MPLDTCIACGRHPKSAGRESVVRQISKQLSRPAHFPVVYRLVDHLGLCVTCLEQLPLIGEEICERCGRSVSATSVCGDCQAVTCDPLVANRSLLLYNDWGKGLMSRFKYRGDERLAEFFSCILALAFYRHYPSHQFDVITYVPLHPSRLEERGFNQVELVAARLGRMIRLPVRPLLTRIKQTDKLSQQTGRASRLESMRSAFAFSSTTEPVHPSSLLIVDDIFTTGSTLRSCALTLQKAVPCEIYGLTIYR